MPAGSCDYPASPVLAVADEVGICSALDLRTTPSLRSATPSHPSYGVRVRESDEQTAPLDLAVDLSADHLLITVRGDVDYSTEDQLRRYLEHSTAALGSRVLVLDLSAVSCFGSVGIAILLDTAEEVAERSSVGHRFRVVVDETRPVLRPIQISGVQSLIRLHHNLDQALRDEQPPDLR